MRKPVLADVGRNLQLTSYQEVRKKGLMKTGFDNFGLGVLYRYVDFEIEKDQEILDWSANLTFVGPSVFATANF